MSRTRASVVVAAALSALALACGTPVAPSQDLGGGATEISLVAPEQPAQPEQPDGSRGGDAGPAPGASPNAPLVPVGGIPTRTPHPDPSSTATTPPDPTVAVAQERLAFLRYYAGPIDGLAGPATRTAVMAFQKVQGLPADGALGTQTQAALEDPVLPALHAGLADRIEIDLDAQVMFVVLDGDLARIMPISSGNGEPYTYAGGGRARGLTPVGLFTVERKVSGTLNAYFGRLYDAMYFHEGWAIHGSGNVPATPASHGCVRLPRADAAWLFAQVDEGMSVEVRGTLNSFNPAAGETAGTNDPAGSLRSPVAPPRPPPSASIS